VVKLRECSPTNRIEDSEQVYSLRLETPKGTLSNYDKQSDK